MDDEAEAALELSETKAEVSAGQANEPEEEPAAVFPAAKSLEPFPAASSADSKPKDNSTVSESGNGLPLVRPGELERHGGVGRENDAPVFPAFAPTSRSGLSSDFAPSLYNTMPTWPAASSAFTDPFPPVGHPPPHHVQLPFAPAYPQQQPGVPPAQFTYSQNYPYSPAPQYPFATHQHPAYQHAAHAQQGGFAVSLPPISSIYPQQQQQQQPYHPYRPYPQPSYTYQKQQQQKARPPAQQPAYQPSYAAPPPAVPSSEPEPAYRTSCEYCTLRRRKCISEEDPPAPCMRCLRDGLVCVFARVKKRGPKSRVVEPSPPEKQPQQPGPLMQQAVPEFNGHAQMQLGYNPNYPQQGYNPNYPPPNHTANYPQQNYNPNYPPHNYGFRYGYPS